MTAPFYPMGAFSEQTGFVIILFVGLAFGFFLERAGFASARKLSAVFYLRDWAVVQMMFTALVTAMLGLLYLSATGLIEMDAVNLEETFLGGQIAGGLLLGMGFVMGGYCPGTSVVGAASGKLDALVFMGGLVLGTASFGFLFHPLLPLYQAGARGVYSLADWTGLGRYTVGFLVAVMALATFAATEYFGGKKPESAPAQASPPAAAPAAFRGGLVMQLTWKPAAAALLFALSLVLLVGGSIAGTTNPADLARLVASGKVEIKPAELAAWIAQRKPMVVLDLRKAAAFAQYHIPGATNLACEQLAAADLPKDRPLVLCSTDGARAGQAWAVLVARGLDARVLKGGVRQWWAEVATPPDLRPGGSAGGATMLAGAAAVPDAAARPAPPKPVAAAGPAKFKKGASCL
ncbi:MAG: YeeE/YedE family protein [Deltaproteobacteria bacterium]|nr:YeeE/YedE family protein [Deltaproteobacteria bacterium]